MRLLFGGYSEISAGTPSNSFERVLDSVLKPLLTYLYHHGQVHFHLSLSGAEMELLDKLHPAFNLLISDLGKKGILTLGGGTYHQGVLSMLPPKDRTGQIELKTSEIRKIYRQKVDTFFCYEQVFSPFFLNAISFCGMKRLLISVPRSLAEDPFIMQDLDKEILVLPISGEMAALTRQYAARQLAFPIYLQCLANLLDHTEQESLVCFMNLDQLAQGGITADETTQLCELFFSHSPVAVNAFDDTKKREYLCDGWYGLDCEKFDLPSFNHLLMKDELLGNLNGRYVNMNLTAKSYKRNKDNRKNVEKLISKSGDFSFCMMDANASMLRMGCKQKLVHEIHEAINYLQKDPEFHLPEVFDYNRDGIDEYLLASKNLMLLVSPKGGSIRELVYVPTGSDFAIASIPLEGCGTLSSSRYTNYGRRMLLASDLFLPAGSTPSHLAFPADGDDSLYEVDASQISKGELTLRVCHDGLLLTKHYRLRANTLMLDITIANATEETKEGVYALSCPVSLTPDSSVVPVTVNEEQARRYRTSPEGELVLAHINSVRAYGSHHTFTIYDLNSCTLLKEHVKVEASTVNGREELYQFFLAVPFWPYKLAKGERLDLSVGFRVARKNEQSV